MGRNDFVFKRRFYSYVFGNDEGEFYKYLYHGTNFNELINAIKEEMVNNLGKGYWFWMKIIYMIRVEMSSH